MIVSRANTEEMASASLAGNVERFIRNLFRLDALVGLIRESLEFSWERARASLASCGSSVAFLPTSESAECRAVCSVAAVDQLLKDVTDS